MLLSCFLVQAMTDHPAQCPENDYLRDHVERLLDSYRRLLAKPLLEVVDAETLGRQVYDADFALLSHGTESDPLFNYANKMALELFEFSWQEFIGMPSRFSAEPVNREARERLLIQVAEHGYIDDYAGVRIAKSGRRFMIQQAVVWNVHDRHGHYCGQAAWFRDWRFLP